MKFLSITLVFTTALCLPGSDDLYRTANQKVESIANEQAPRGSTITLSSEEVNALVRGKIREKKLEGVRDPRVDLSEGGGIWSAVVEFGKLPQLERLRNNFLLSGVLKGEKPVTTEIEMHSGGGQATIDVKHVTIGETRFEGRVLAFLVESLILSDFPDAKIGEPFPLKHHVDQIKIRPGGLAVTLRK